MDIKVGYVPKNSIQKKSTQKKYPILRTISSIYKVLGVLLLCSSLLFFIFDQNLFIVLIVGLFLSVSSFALSECILVFLDIEENTRNKKN